MQGMTLEQANEMKDFISEWTEPTLVELPDGSWEVQATIEQPEIQERIKKLFSEALTR